MKILARSLVLVLAVGASAQSRAQDRVDVNFSITYTTQNQGFHVFVVGDLPELGGNDLLQAVKLQSTNGTDWSVTVSLPVNRNYTYQFYERWINAVAMANPQNGNAITGVMAASTPTVALDPADKTVHYHSELSSPRLHWRQDDGVYQVRELSALAPGRTPLERRWIATGLGESRRMVEFYFTDAQGGSRDPAVGTYQTPLDEFFVQDAAIYSYVPASAVSPHRRDYDPANPPSIQSSILGADRVYRVMLPRGYDEHVTRDYPVMYMYDGPVLWDVVGGYDDDGLALAGLVDGGRVGEMILVAIDPFGTFGTCAFPMSRARDCLSPEDMVVIQGCGTVTGMADQFGAFIRDELKPLIDSQYRTLPDKEHTFAQGYSFGGVFAMYMAWEFSDTFGGVGSQSGSFWVPNFTARIMLEPKRDVRVYMDTGTVNDNYTPVLFLRDNLVGKMPPFVEEGDFRYRLAYGHNHTFFNGGLRLPQMMEFLYPATAEEPELWLGESYCSSTPNSTGRAAEINATGSTSVASNAFRIHAFFVPPGEFGYFLTSPTQGLVPIGGSQGNLCLGGSIGRFVGPGEVMNSGMSGSLSLTVDLNALPTPTGPVAAQPGETWNFQAWHRDLNPGPTSNLTDAASVTFH